MEATQYASRIRTLRERHGLSRAELAVQASVSYSTLTKAEQGQRVGTEALVRIFAVLAPSMTVAELSDH